MQETITISDLIRFIYEDTDKEEAEHICSAILSNDALSEEWLELSKIKDKLDSVAEEPSELSIRKIMNYSNSVSSFAYSSKRLVSVLN